MNTAGSPAIHRRAGTRTTGGDQRRPARRAPACSLLLAAWALATALPAQAASDPSCRVDTSAAQIAFGTYDPLSALPLDATGRIDVICDKNNIAVRVELDRGAGGSYLPRRMQSGSQTLDYNLYLDPGRSIVFGNGTGATQAGAGITSEIGGGEFRARVPLYGRIAPGLDAAFGSYSDSINVSVTF